MSELFLIIEKFIIHYPEPVTWGGVVVLFLIGVALQTPYIKESTTEWKLNHLLKNLGRESLHHVTIPDGMDGNIFIEHLILTPKEIVLLGVKKYRGLIFAGEKIDLWTQVIGNKSYKFENPLHQLETDVLALNSQIENSKVEKKVLFISGSEFPKGKPDNIVFIQDVKDWRRNYAADEIPDALRTDWKRLLEVASRDELSNAKGVLLDEENTSGLNMYALISIFTAISLWLVWRLMY